MTAAGERALLELDVATSFVIGASGRIERESEPDGSPGPRAALFGCAAGNIARLRHDVGEEAASQITAMVEAAPPWSDADALPPWIDNAAAVLAAEAPVTTVGPGAIFHLPHGVKAPVLTEIVRGDEPEGEALLATLARDGTPSHLREAGFASVDDFWPPWCVALEDRQIAAMAFAARIGAGGVEIGVYTFPRFRGRGLAAAVTAAWAALPSLTDRTLFYSTQASNRSSRRVAARLGLRQFGASVRIT